MVMKQPDDLFTLDAFDKPRRGRPRKPNAKSGAQRQREYRLRRRLGVLESPRYGIPIRSVFAPSERLIDVIRRLENERHTKRVSDIQSMGSQLAQLEPIVRSLETRGIVLPVNDIKYQEGALIIRETGTRSQLLVDTLISLGLIEAKRTYFLRHCDVRLTNGDLILSVYFPLTTEEERAL